MRGLRAGELRERVQIQQATITRNSFGEEQRAWTTTATVWAQVVERGGSEPVLADMPVMLVSYEVTVRSGPTLGHGNRVIWRGKTLDVQTVTPVPAQGLVMLRCLEAA